MRITLSGDTQRHLDTMRLTFPFSEDDLKKNYRDLAKKVHPDVIKKATNEDFLKLQNAYEYLQAYTLVEESEAVLQRNNPHNDDDMFALKEKCPHCTGGNILRKRTAYYHHDCEKCNDDSKRKVQNYKVPVGMVGVPCKKCNAGKFTLKSGRVVDCVSCKGSGFHKYQTCSKCGGEGEYTIPKEIQYWDKCMYCAGLGYKILDVFNPVIPHGAILR